jgi:hypothetical protein
MTKSIGYRGYKLNPVKLAGASQSILPYVCGAFYYTEDFEYFNIIKPYLEIPEKPKTLEEISQELDEKFEKLIEDVEYKFAQLKYYQEYQFSKKITRIIEDIEYARKNGSFPEKHRLIYSDNLGTNNFTSSFIIKSGGKEVGYYTFGNRKYFKYFMDEKPNFVVRFCMDKLLGFKWIDV